MKLGATPGEHADGKGSVLILDMDQGGRSQHGDRRKSARRQGANAPKPMRTNRLGERDHVTLTVTQQMACVTPANHLFQNRNLKERAGLMKLDTAPEHTTKESAMSVPKEEPDELLVALSDERQRRDSAVLPHGTATIQQSTRTVNYAETLLKAGQKLF